MFYIKIYNYLKFVKVELSVFALSALFSSCKKSEGSLEATQINLSQKKTSVSKTEGVVTTLVVDNKLVGDQSVQIEAGPDNSLYVLHDFGIISKRSKDGAISTVLDIEKNGFEVHGFRVTKDGTLYYFGTENKTFKLVKLSPNCQPIVLLNGYDITAISVESDGSLYAINRSAKQLLKISKENIVTVITTHPDLGDIQFGNGIAVDANKNIYATGFHKILKITQTGVVSTFAGSNLPYLSGGGGYVDGPGANAKFDWIIGITIDSEGNLFVAENNNNRVRQITPEGLVSTLAGGAISDKPYLDGTGANAKFSFLSGITIDKNDVLYTVDWHQRVAKITYK